MRYTIPGTQNDRARVVVRNRPMPRGEWWAIVRRGDLLNGLMGRDHLPPVHRERVRFGAWEERPRAVVTYVGAERAVAHLFKIRRRPYERVARRMLTIAAPYVGAWDGVVSDHEVARLARTFAHLDWVSGAR